MNRAATRRSAKATPFGRLRYSSAVTLVIATAAILAMTAKAVAQENEIREAMRATLAAWNDGDFEAVAAHYAPETRGFFLDGGILLRGFNLPGLQMAYAAGFRAGFEVRDIDVQLHGDVAVSVALLDGSLTLPGGEAQEGTWRYSEVRVKTGDAWRIVQYHFSPMTVPPAR